MNLDALFEDQFDEEMHILLGHTLCAALERALGLQ